VLDAFDQVQRFGAGVEEVRLGGDSGSRQSFTPQSAIRQSATKRIGGIVHGLGVRGAGWNTALRRRAEDHQLAAQVPATAGQLDQVVGGPAPDMLVGRGDVQALGACQKASAGPTG